MLKKALLGLFSVLLVFFGYEVAPIHAIITPTTIVSAKVTTFEILGEEATVKVYRYDTVWWCQHFVSFDASCEIDGIRFMNVSTEKYPLYKIKSSLSSASICSIPGEWKYLWDTNITFVKSPGPSQIYIKYDHPDNYDTYHQGEVNVNYQLQGNEKIHYHIAQYKLEEGKQTGSLFEIAAALIAIVAAALAFPEPVVSKVVAAFVGLLATILAAVGVMITYFIETKLQTELGDGWAWLWGFGNWWIFRWWWQSFGAWRDWPWFFVVLSTSWDVTNHVWKPSHSGIFSDTWCCLY